MFVLWKPVLQNKIKQIDNMSIVPINTLMCPISLQIFKCPVVIADGFTYEYAEIKI